MKNDRLFDDYESAASGLSVLIVNWNTREMLVGCLGSLGAWPAAEIIVVDNGSRDGSTGVVRERFPKVRLIENRANAGFAAASNQGLRAASGRYALLLNSDTLVCPGALDALGAFMDAHPRAGACGALLINADGSLQPSAHPMLTPERELWRLLFLERLVHRATYPMDRWDVNQPRRVDVIKGACLMLRREALDQIGLFDESYFMYTEEVDLCYRLAQADWELWWVPQARVVHYGAESSRQVREDMYLQLYRSKVQFYRKFGGTQRAERFKRYLRLAYAPRWFSASIGSLISPKLVGQARIFHRLLATISDA